LVIAHQTAFAVDLVQAPPGTLQPYVMPNVIISIDDSGSMNYRLDPKAHQEQPMAQPRVLMVPGQAQAAE
jgi:type IV pilus assembly protein PilY1